MVVEVDGAVGLFREVVVVRQRLELQPAELEGVDVPAGARQLPGALLVHGAEAAQVHEHPEVQRHLGRVGTVNRLCMTVCNQVQYFNHGCFNCL